MRRRYYNEAHMGSVAVHGHRDQASGVVLHFTSGRDGTVASSVAALNEHGLGYEAIIHKGVIYSLAKPDQVLYHCKGKNRSHIGVAIKHEGLRKSPCERSVPAVNRRNGQPMHQRRYTARDLEQAALHVADLLRGYCVPGCTEVLFHDELDPSKNDPGPAFPRRSWLEAVHALVRGEEPADFTQMEPEGFDYT